MGVMACDRNGCKEIMCDTLVLNVQYYLYSHCFNELKRSKKDWPREMSKADIYNKIFEFINSKIGTFEMLDEGGVDEEFNNLTGKI